jgi:hypothetical protein
MNDEQMKERLKAAGVMKAYRAKKMGFRSLELGSIGQEMLDRLKSGTIQEWAEEGMGYNIHGRKSDEMTNMLIRSMVVIGMNARIVDLGTILFKFNETDNAYPEHWMEADVLALTGMLDISYSESPINKYRTYLIEHLIKRRLDSGLSFVASSHSPLRSKGGWWSEGLLSKLEDKNTTIAV